MGKRYLGGGVSFEQENVYQEFSESDTPSGEGSLESLSDVNITDPVDGQTLVYNATAGKWENGEGGGSGTLVVHVVYDGDDARLDKTYAEISSAGYAVLANRTNNGDGQYTIDVLPLFSFGYASDGVGSPEYFVIFYNGQDTTTCLSETQDGYLYLEK